MAVEMKRNIVGTSNSCLLYIVDVDVQIQFRICLAMYQRGWKNKSNKKNTLFT